MSHRLTFTLALAVTLIATGCASNQAAKSPPAAGGAGAGKPGADGPKPWAEVTKGAERTAGFFAVHRKRDQLFLEIPEDRMNVDFLGIFSFARGIGLRGLLGGLPLNDRLLAFERHGNQVLLIERATRFVAPADSPVGKAKDLSIGNSVLAAFKVESIHDSSKAVLIDVTPLLISDFTDLAEGMKEAFGNKSVRFDKERSSLASVKSFPDNLEIEARLTYTPNDRTDLNLYSVPDERYIPITVHYSFSKLPEKPMQPRLADDRVGYFVTVKKDFGNDQAESFFVRYAEHWRLEKKDPSAAVSDPVKPIVYYVDHTVPEQYRPWVKRGIENWQKAYLAAGFSNAIIARDAPDDPDWDAEDVRYSTVRWIESAEPAFNAIGPSRTDPRTGEILDADVLIEGAAIQGYRNWWRRFAGPTALAEATMPTLPTGPSWLPLERRCEDQLSAADQGALLRLDLMLAGDLPPGSPVPDEFLEPLVVRLVMHEIGHTLGLRHNFRSSTSTPYDKLHDRAWTAEHGLIGSVMDYVTPNISADRAKQGEYFITSIGPYDEWAIRYAHTPSGETDLQKDYAFAEKIAAASLEPGHEYATDDDTYPANALDPRTNVYDLSDDPLRWAEDRAAYLRTLWKNPHFEQRILGDRGEYPVLRRATDMLLQQYGLALGMGVKYVGGQRHVRLHHGQGGGVEPLTPIPAAEQRRALDFLSKRAFAADAFDFPPALLNTLAADRWGHWGMPSPFAPEARVDYDFENRVFAIQGLMLNRLTAPELLARLREAENRSAEPFTLAEHFDRMTKMLWDDVTANPDALRALDRPGTRRLIQRAYVDRLATMIATDVPGLPDDARALARLQLTRIDARARGALAAKAKPGDAVQAHLLETRARITRALEAERTADRRALGGGGMGGGAAGDR
jgi:Met-zincin/Domain of unknown function (DUF5117)/Domain of unknown function (DUF5118)